MESININVQVDANDKKLFDNFCRSIDMNESTAINMSIKAVYREKKLPFEVKIYDDIISNKLEEAEVEMSNTRERYSKEDILKSMNNIIG